MPDYALLSTNIRRQNRECLGLTVESEVDIDVSDMAILCEITIPMTIVRCSSSVLSRPSKHGQASIWLAQSHSPTELFAAHLIGIIIDFVCF